MDKFYYDSKDPADIERHAKGLIGKSFREVMPEATENRSSKGNLGTLLEKHYFGYKPNSEAAPDFADAGVELKVTPYKELKRGKKFSAKERLVLNIINYQDVIKEEFDKSSFYHKNQLLLMVNYLWKEELERLDYPITHAQLFQFPESDLEVIKADWEFIVDKIKAGQAHLLSEGDTSYLGACTKGANKNSLRSQPYSERMAMQRAFSLKGSYMTVILNEYILKGVTTYKKMVDGLGGRRLEEWIVERMNGFTGMTVEELEHRFSVDSTAKSKLSMLASRMLNDTFDDAGKSEEFQKAKIKLKTMRIGMKGKLKEEMSFPNFKYTEIVNQTWEESDLREMFETTKYLFVVFREINADEYVFDRVVMWNMPLKTLDSEVKVVWEETVRRIRNNQADKLPKKSEFSVCHVRPKALKKSDTYPTPFGGAETKKCFWLNREYILQVINGEA
ncbi:MULTISPECIES: Sau3AI family type II restriction endonuclease [unclassified Exiguobacterium]|uniref:Sau3AI family type II restriction endonuclease n=1 Tax=unclassified Exiguobacterium TaxID=2644629 RepID=UPI001BEB6EF4|nr:MULTISPECIES: Sau3AI family type II restriction endonuclease [unclassified Exiguobacterium]